MSNEMLEMILSKMDEKFKAQEKAFEEMMEKRLEEQAKIFDERLDSLYSLAIRNDASAKEIKDELQYLNKKFEENDERFNYLQMRMTNMERKNDIQVKKLENQVNAAKRDIVKTIDVFFRAM